MDPKFDQANKDESSENVQSKIEALGGDEKEFFTVKQTSSEALEDINEIRWGNQIDKETAKKLSDHIADLEEKASDPLIGKIGKEKARDILELEKERVKQKVESGISQAKSIPELYKVIDRSGGIQGSRDSFSPEELKKAIDAVVNVSRKTGNITGDQLITRSFGLRDRVTEIIEAEIKRQ